MSTTHATKASLVNFTNTSETTLMQMTGIIIVGGDFNTHHPVWNSEGYTHHDEEADAPVDMMAELELSLLLPLGTITYPNAGTTIDLIWGSNEVVDHTITRRIERTSSDSDHGTRRRT